MTSQKDLPMAGIHDPKTYRAPRRTAPDVEEAGESDEDESEEVAA